MTLQEENRKLRFENDLLREEVKILTAKVEQLLKIIEDLGHKKNSQNSSLPPSSDITRKNKSLRGRSNKKSGGQPGHKGSTLFQSKNPDIVTELKSNFCKVCGHDLSDANFEIKSRRQVVDIPPTQPVYHEYRQYSCNCPHCHNEQVTEFPPEISAPIQYGSSIQSLVSYLSVYQYIPYARLKELLSQIFHIHLSEGTIENLLLKASSKSEAVYHRIKEELKQSAVVGSDETGAKANGDKIWIWTWQNLLNTYLVPSANRGYKTIKGEFEEGLPLSVLVSDRLSAQLKTPAQGHQVCLAHLLREIIFIEEVENHLFAPEFNNLLRSIFEFKRNQKYDYAVNSPETKPFEENLNIILALTISKEDYPKTATFQNSMIKVRNNILPCLYRKDIPPDNSGSERAVRNMKVKQKISGQFKTGQKAFCILRSAIDTAKKRKCDIMDTLKLIMLINPKTIPE